VDTRILSPNVTHDEIEGRGIRDVHQLGLVVFVNDTHTSADKEATETASAINDHCPRVATSREWPGVFVVRNDRPLLSVSDWLCVGLGGGGCGCMSIVVGVRGPAIAILAGGGRALSPKS
jgi:hypothetical protein